MSDWLVIFSSAETIQKDGKGRKKREKESKGE